MQFRNKFKFIKKISKNISQNYHFCIILFYCRSDLIHGYPFHDLVYENSKIFKIIKNDK